MPPILTAQAVITCVHGGQVLAIPRQTKVLIAGAPVLCVPDLVGAPIAGCPVPPTLATKPCTTVLSTLPGSWSLKVTANGMPVYLSTLTGLTDGVPPGTIMVVFPGQVLVQAQG
jgi:hypothetical protein